MVRACEWGNQKKRSLLRLSRHCYLPYASRQNATKMLYIQKAFEMSIFSKSRIAHLDRGDETHKAFIWLFIWFCPSARHKQNIHVSRLKRLHHFTVVSHSLRSSYFVDWIFTHEISGKINWNNAIGSRNRLLTNSKNFPIDKRLTAMFT